MIARLAGLVFVWALWLAVVLLVLGAAIPAAAAVAIAFLAGAVYLVTFDPLDEIAPRRRRW